MAVISVNLDKPTLVYKKIEAKAVPSSEPFKWQHGSWKDGKYTSPKSWGDVQVSMGSCGQVTNSTHTEMTHGLAANKNQINKIIDTMWSGHEQDDLTEVQHTKDSLMSRVRDTGLHDCTLENEVGTWHFIQVTLSKTALIEYFKNADPEYMGGFRKEMVTQSFIDDYNKGMAIRLIENEEFETVGNAMQSQVGVIERFVDLILKEFKLEDVMAEQFNHYDGESCFKTRLGGIDYFYFDQG